MRDNASPRLRKLRAELRNGRHRVTERLEQLVRSSGWREHLQEDFVTQRGGRPVLAVRASSRKSVPGIVHDASDSGRTLFVEPFEVVELTNRLSEATGAERDEVERILREPRRSASRQRRCARRSRRQRPSTSLALATVSRGWHGTPIEQADECGSPAHATRFSIRRRRCRSTSSSARCGRS